MAPTRRRVAATTAVTVRSWIPTGRFGRGSLASGDAVLRLCRVSAVSEARGTSDSLGYGRVVSAGNAAPLGWRQGFGRIVTPSITFVGRGSDRPMWLWAGSPIGRRPRSAAVAVHDAGQPSLGVCPVDSGLRELTGLAQQASIATRVGQQQDHPVHAVVGHLQGGPAVGGLEVVKRCLGLQLAAVRGDLQLPVPGPQVAPGPVWDSRPRCQSCPQGDGSGFAGTSLPLQQQAGARLSRQTVELVGEHPELGHMWAQVSGPAPSPTSEVANGDRSAPKPPRWLIRDGSSARSDLRGDKRVRNRAVA